MFPGNGARLTMSLCAVCTRMPHAMRQGRVFACWLLYLLLLLLPAQLTVSAAGIAAASRNADGAIGRSGSFTRTIRMPGAVSEKEDDLICHAMKLDPRQHQYILKYEPHATKKIAHHMMLYGCETPGSTAPMWRCGGQERGELAVCGTDEASSGGSAEAGIVYAWALDAPPTEFPEGVGLRVGGDTQIQYVILQLHYSRKFSDGEKDDSSGVTLHMTYDKLPYQAGFYILGNYGFIPPKTTNFHLESACVYSGDHDMHPIRYRTHSHNLGVVTSGYRIRNGTWTEIGRMSPQAPQTFYPATHSGMTVRKSDILAARCTMTSDRDEPTMIGARNKDEMCNFYIMYYTDKPENLRDIYCFNDAQQFHWKTYLKNVPADASSLRGVNVTGGHGMHHSR